MGKNLNEKKKKITQKRKKTIQILDNIDFLKNQKVGLAVSGGVDSMVLLDLFRKLKEKKYLDLIVLHYNHKWRKESKIDYDLVKRYCDKNHIIFVYKETTGKIIKDEEIARIQRYSFFKKEATKNKLRYICTAHHKDDQVETILFRLARGTGPNGFLPIKIFLSFHLA